MNKALAQVATQVSLHMILLGFGFEFWQAAIPAFLIGLVIRNFVHEA